MGKSNTPAKKQNPFALTPEEANGGAAKKQNPFALTPEEAGASSFSGDGNAKKKDGTTWADTSTSGDTTGASASPSSGNEPAPLAGAAAGIAGSAAGAAAPPQPPAQGKPAGAGKQNLPAGQAGVNPADAMYKPPVLGSRNVVDIDGQKVDLNSPGVVPLVAAEKDRTRAIEELYGRVSNGTINDNDAAILSRVTKMPADLVKKAVFTPAAYDRDKAIQHLSEDLNNNIRPANADQQAATTAIKTSILKNPDALNGYLTQRNKEFEKQLADLDKKKKQYEQQVVTGAGMDGSVNMTAEIIDPVKHQQATDELQAVMKQRAAFNESAMKLLDVQLNRSYANKDFTHTEAEQVGAAKKKVIMPVAYNNDQARLNAGHTLSQRTQFDLARAGMESRLYALAADVDDAKAQADKTKAPQDVKRLEDLLHQYQALNDSYPALSDKYPEVRRDEILQGATDAFHQMVKGKETKVALGLQLGIDLDDPNAGYFKTLAKSGWGAVQLAAAKLFADAPDEKEMAALAKQLNIPVDQLRKMNLQESRTEDFNYSQAKKQLDAQFPHWSEDKKLKMLEIMSDSGGAVREDGFFGSVSGTLRSSLDNFKKFRNRAGDWQWLNSLTGGTPDPIGTDIKNEKIDRQIHNETRMPGSNNLFRLPTKIDLRKTDKDGNANPFFTREVQNRQGGNLNLNLGSFIHTVGDTGGQMAMFAIAGDGIGTVVKGLGEVGNTIKWLASSDLEAGGISAKALNRAGELAGTFGSSFAMGYDDYYKNAAQYTNSEAKRHLSASVNAAIDGTSELIFPDVDVVKAMRGEKNLFKIFDRVLKDNNGVWTANAFKQYGAAIGKALSVNTIEAGEEVFSSIGQALADHVILGKELNTQDMKEDAKQSFVTTFIGTIPDGIGAGIGSASQFKKNALYESGVSPTKYTAYIQGLQAQGRMSQAKADQHIRNINTMADIVKGLPQTNANGERYSDDERAEIAAQEFRIRRNQQLAKTSPVTAVREAAEQDSEEAKHQQAAVINKMPAAPTDDTTPEGIEEMRQHELDNTEGVSNAHYKKQLENKNAHDWQISQANSYLADPVKHLEAAIKTSEQLLANDPDNKIAQASLKSSTAELEKVKAINEKYDEKLSVLKAADGEEIKIPEAPKTKGEPENITKPIELEIKPATKKAAPAVQAPAEAGKENLAAQVTQQIQEDDQNPYGGHEQFLDKKVMNLHEHYDDMRIAMEEKIEPLQQQQEQKQKELKGLKGEAKKTKEKEIAALVKQTNVLQAENEKHFIAFNEKLGEHVRERAKVLGVPDEQITDDMVSDVLNEIYERPGIEHNWQDKVSDAIDEAINYAKAQGSKEDIDLEDTLPEAARKKIQEHYDYARELYDNSKEINPADYGLEEMTQEERKQLPVHQQMQIIRGETRGLKTFDRGDIVVDAYSGKAYRLLDRKQEKKGTIYQLESLTTGKITTEGTEHGEGRNIFLPVNKTPDIINEKSNRPAQGHTAGQAGESSADNSKKPVKDARTRTKGTRKSNRKIKDPTYKKALDIESTEPEDHVLQYFIGGGNINPSAIIELFGSKRNTIEENRAKTKGEFKARLGLLHGEGPGIKELAHTLWERHGGLEDGALHDDQAYRNAVEKVFHEFNTRSAMATHLNEKYNSTFDDAESAEAKWYREQEEAAKHFATEQDVHDAIDLVQQLSEEDIDRIIAMEEAGASDAAVIRQAELYYNFHNNISDEEETKPVDEPGGSQSAGSQQADSPATPEGVKPAKKEKPANKKPAATKQGTEKTNEQKEVEAQLDTAIAELAAARNAFNDKKKALDKGLMEDNADLFGGRKSENPNALFNERADPAARDKALEPFKGRITNAEKELRRLQDKLADLQGKPTAQVSMLDQITQEQQQKQAATETATPGQAAPVANISTEEQQIREELNDKLQQLRASMKAARSGLNSGIDPIAQAKIIANAVDVLTTFAKLGIYKFKEIIKEIIPIFGKDWFDKENTDTLKGVYAYHRSKLSREERKQYDNEDAVDDFVEQELPQLLKHADDGNNDTAASDTAGGDQGQLDGTVQAGRTEADVQGRRPEGLPGQPGDTGIREDRRADEQPHDAPGRSTGIRNAGADNAGGSDSAGRPVDSATPAASDNEQPRLNLPTGQAGPNSFKTVILDISGEEKETPARLKDSDPANHNFVIPEGTDIVPQGNAAKVNANMNAVLLSRKLDSENRNPSPEEKGQLARFVGWGGLASYLGGSQEDALTKSIFTGQKFSIGQYSWNKAEYQPAAPLVTEGQDFETIADAFKKAYQAAVNASPNITRYVPEEARQKGVTLDFARKQVIAHLLDKEAFNAAKVSTENAHYTEGTVIRNMWGLVKHLGFTGGNILESSAGIGHFFGMMPQDIAGNSNMTGVELDPVTGKMLKQLYPENQTFIKGFQDVNLPNNSIDLAIGNVPFASTGRIYDKRNKDIQKFSLHNYFIAKNLRLLKPGGIAVLITSKATMDNMSSAEARRWFASTSGGNSDLISAVRLPNNAFEKNAGTQVTTDVLVFRKRTSQIADTTNPFFTTTNMRSEMYEGEKIDIDINEYFAHHPEQMIGDMKFAYEVGSGGLYGKTDATLHAPAGVNVMDKMKELFDKMPANIFSAGAVEDKEEKKPERIYSSEKSGKLFGKDGKLFISEGDQATEAEFRYKTHEAVATDYLPLRDAIYPLLEAELKEDSTDEAIEAHRAELNKQYDAFVKKHGSISQHSRWLFAMDVDYPLAAALENVKTKFVDDGTGNQKKELVVTKGDMLLKRINFPRSTPKSADNNHDAVRISMAYKGGVDAGYIAKLTGAESADAAKAALLKEGLVFENPTTGILEIPDNYLSGQVRSKLEQAKEAAKENAEYQRNVDALEAVQPKAIPAGSIKFRMGVSYLPVSMYREFTKDLLGVDAKISFMPSLGQWQINAINGEYDARNLQTWGVKGETSSVTGLEVLKSVMANSTITIKVRIDKDKYKVDETATQAAADMQQKINSSFERWVKSNEDRRNTLEKEFNDKFNNYVEPRTSLPPFKYYPGAVHTIELREHQKKAVLRSLNGNTLLAHDVGTGKTYTIITTAMEMRRLGLAKKPMIVVKNATLNSFAEDFAKLYPTAKVLVLSRDQMDGKNRKFFFGKIATGDWDAVIIPQSQFDMIPDKPERVMAYLEEKIEEMRALMNETDDRFLAQRLQKEIEAMEEQLHNVMLTPEDKKEIEEAGKKAADKESSKGGKAKAKKEGERLVRLTTSVKRLTDRKTDNLLDFDEMGVDAMFVDESHSYKRLGFQTNLTKVKGIDVAASKKSVSAYLKTQAVMERTGGKNVIFATGTPVTNTMAELWTNMRFLTPDLIREMGIQTFDQFQKTFTDVVDSLEQNAGGNFEMVNRLSNFFNLPELVTAFRSFADVVATNDVPEFKSNPDLAPPKIEGDKIKTTVLPITPTLRGVMLNIKNEYDRYKKMSGKEKKANSWMPLLLYQIGKVAPIDPRLVNPDLADEGGSKANAAVANALKLYKEYDQYKAAQMIFSDSVNASDTPNVRFLLGLGPTNKSFNLYDDIKKKLIAGGVPAGEIAIMTDKKWDGDDKREKLFELVRAGEIRFMLGSTEKMGVGVNVQERLIGLHHIDAPARPDQFTQRNGRIVRQGNMFAKLGIPVHVQAYGMEGTRDATAFQRLEKKQGFITQLFKGDITQRESADEAAEEVENIDDFFAELGASLSGNKDALKLVMVKRDLRLEEGRLYTHEQRMIDVNNAIRQQQRDLSNKELLIKTADDAKAYLEEHFPDRKISAVTIDGHTYTEKLNDVLQETVIDPLEKKAKQILKDKQSGFEKVQQSILIGDTEAVIIVRAEQEARGGGQLFGDITTALYVAVPNLAIGVVGDPDRSFTGGGRGISSGTAHGMMQVLRNSMERIDDNPQKYRTALQKTQENIAQLEGDAKEGYDRTKLDKLYAEKAKLEKAILATGDLKRYRVEKLDDQSWFIYDSVGEMEYTAGTNEPHYYPDEAIAKATAEQLNKNFIEKAANTKYVVKRMGDRFAVVDREDSEKPFMMKSHSFDQASLMADLFNDEHYGNNNGEYHPMLTWNDKRGEEAITMGKKTPDENNKSGYRYEPDGNTLYATAAEAYAAAQLKNEGGGSANSGGGEEDDGNDTDLPTTGRPGDMVRRLKINTSGMMMATILPAPQLWNAAIEVVAKAIDTGAAIADALRKGYDHIRRQQPDGWSKEAYNREMIAALKAGGKFQYNLSPTQQGAADKIIRQVAKGGNIVQLVTKVRDKFSEAKKQLLQAGATQAEIDDLEDSYKEFERYLFDNNSAQYYESLHNRVLDLGIPEQTRMQKINENYADRFQRMNQTQKAMEKAGIVINENNDIINRADRFRSIAEAKVKEELARIGIADFDVLFWNKGQKIKGSLFEQMNTAGIELKLFGDYMRALHAPERNAHNAKLRREKFHKKLLQLESDHMAALADQANMPSAKNKAALTRAENLLNHYEEYLNEYSNPDGNKNYLRTLEETIPKEMRLMDDGASGLTNKDAADIVQQVEDTGKKADYDKFFAIVKKDIIDKSLGLMRDYDMITPEDHDYMAMYYKNYVPLAVEDAYFDDKEGGYSGKFGDSKIHYSTGADYITGADRVNPLMQAIVRLQHIIADGEENRFSQTVAQAIEDAPDDKVWSVEPVMFTPQRDNDGRLLGLNKLTAPKNSIPFFAKGGKQMYLVIQDDALFKAITGKNVKAAIRLLSKASTFFRAMATVYNTDFTVTNLVRDLQTAGFTLSANESQEVRKAFRKNRRAIFRYIKGSYQAAGDPMAAKAAQSEIEKLVHRFNKAGGQMSWWRPETNDEIKTNAEEAYNRYNKNPTQKNGFAVGMNFFHWMDRMNGAIEQGTRLAVFDAALKGGVPEHKAVEMARNATVNFNRKGNYGALIDSLYLFFNANVQGNLNVMRSVLLTKRGKYIAGGIALAGLLQSLYNNWAGDCSDSKHPEDCYDNVPDYEKERNVMFKLPWAHGFGKLPAAYGYNMFYNFGETIGQAFQDKMTVGEAALYSVGNILDSFNPVSSASSASFLSKIADPKKDGSKEAIAYGLQAVSPTITDPFLQWYSNKDAFGRSIYSDFEYDKRPDNQKGTPINSAQSIAFAKWLNSATGGGDKLSGALDVQPGTIDFIGETLFGGAGKAFERFALTGGAGVQEMAHLMGAKETPDIELRDVPFLNRFYSTPKEHFERQNIYDVLDESYTHKLSKEDIAGMKAEIDKEVKAGVFDATKGEKYYRTVQYNQFEIQNKGIGSFLEKAKTEVLDDDEIGSFYQDIQDAVDNGQLPAAALRKYKQEISKAQHGLAVEDE